MDGRTQNGGSSQLDARPRPITQHSASLPSTPRQRAHDFYSERTPSPSTATGGQSPNSTSSDSFHHIAFTKSNATTLPTCRFQSTQTARRRMPYDSSDPLSPESPAPKAYLSVPEELRLNDEIGHLYRESLPSLESQRRREQVAEKIKNILVAEYPGKDVHVSVFGSSGNLLNTDHSDVDICVTMKDLEHVCTLASLLARNEMKGVKCVHAKGVPIVKIWDPELQMSCDLNVNNHLALINTKLVKAYMEVDERARILAMAVKYWSKRRILNEASGGGLSSYTWTLLVINFLQICKPPVLPVIELKDAEGNTKTDFNADSERFDKFGAANKQSAGALVFHFFRRFAHDIDYETAVLSVRAGRLLTKAEKGWDHLVSQRLCCEEPFNNARNLGNTADEFSFHGIHLELRQAFTRILQGLSFRQNVCEQFRFPEIESKHIFERPAPGSRPVTLTRSTSQSGRGGRFGSNRGNRMRNDPRNGNANRRASSASAYGNDIPAFYLPPGYYAPGFFIPPGQIPSNASFERSQQQISDQIDQLKQQQLALYNQSLSRMQALDLDRTYSSGSSSSQSRQVRDGRQERFQNLATTSLPSPVSSVAFPRVGPVDSPPSMSYSSSQQGTSTDPSSPMLPNAAPLRRTVQRTPGPESPGAAHRSQSQPARGYFPQMAQNAYGAFRPGYLPAIPMNYNIRPGQQQLYAGPVFVPYPYNPAMQTMYPTFVQDQNDSQPREYIGYSLSPTPTSAFSQDLQQIPAYEDLHRQSRSHSPSRRSPLINAENADPSTSRDDSRPVSPLPAPAEIAQSSPSLPPAIASSAPSDLRSPLIVNGSFSAASLPYLSAQRTRREPDMAHGNSSSQNNHLPHQTELATSPEGFTGAGMFVIEHTDSSNSTNELVRKSTSSSTRAEAKPQGLAIAFQQTSPNIAEGAFRRSGGNSRSQMSPLDLGAPAERTAPPALMASLSPVREQATPSPTEVRKPVGAPIVNGSNGSPMPFSRAAVASGITMDPPMQGNNGISVSKPAPKPVSPNTASASSTANATAPSSEWQQAGTRKSARRKSQQIKTGGQPMPANVAERKGG